MPQVKCHRYYPELGEVLALKDGSVTGCAQSEFTSYTLRTLVLEKVRSGQSI